MKISDCEIVGKQQVSFNFKNHSILFGKWFTDLKYKINHNYDEKV